MALEESDIQEQADSQPANTQFDSLEIVAVFPWQRRIVARIRTADNPQQQRRISHAARHGARDESGPGIHERHTAIARFQAGNAAMRRWLAYRAARVRTERGDA